MTDRHTDRTGQSDRQIGRQVVRQADRKILPMGSQPSGGPSITNDYFLTNDQSVRFDFETSLFQFIAWCPITVEFEQYKSTISYRFYCRFMCCHLGSLYHKIAKSHMIF